MISANKWLIGAAGAVLVSAVTMWEGTRYYAYYDVAGVPTVCQGYTGSGITFGKKYSPTECAALLKKDLYVHSVGMLNCIKRPLNENQYNAFTMFTFNVGVAGACSSRAFRLFNEGQTEAACKAMAYSPSGTPAWSYAGGKFVQGLHNRRIYEMKMCLGV